jgi:hypothetical protein
MFKKFDHGFEILDIQRPQEGPCKVATQAMIEKLGPLTTRGNEKNEKSINIL